MASAGSTKRAKRSSTGSHGPEMQADQAADDDATVDQQAVEAARLESRARGQDEELGAASSIGEKRGRGRRREILSSSRNGRSIDAIASRRASSREGEEEKGKGEKDNSLFLSMVQLLALASRPPPSLPSWRLALPSFRAIQRFISSPAARLPDLIVNGLLAALPPLLVHRRKSVATHSASLLGAIAISSYESSLQVANDKTVVRALLNMLTPEDAKARLAGCRALLDLASSDPGRKTLRNLGAVEKLMHLLSVSAESNTSSSVSQETRNVLPRQGERVVKMLHPGKKADVVLSEILEALGALIFDGCGLKLETISQDVKASALKTLQKIWKRFYDHNYPRLFGEGFQVLPKLLVWMTMEQEPADDSGDYQGILDKSLFGGLETDFEHFWNEHWERSPILLKEGVDGCETRAGLLCTGSHAESGSLLLQELLTGTLACPPFCSDELESSVIFEEIQEKLGKPLVPGQDIRLVKSVSTQHSFVQAGIEEDYHKVALGGCSLSVEVCTCLDAYDSGYTIAVRGMEFRCPQVAAITEALAVCFGQATAGANLYLTPSKSQGFKLHYDDHCVLVWQLRGSKSWRIFHPERSLPRLYSPEESIRGACSREEPLNILLAEGDVLYIPRGFPHEANTQSSEQHRPLQACPGCIETNAIPKCMDTYGRITGEEHLIHDGLKQHCNCSCVMKLEGEAMEWTCKCINQRDQCHRTFCKDTAYSLHITFGVEIEPPFDWEGFIHMSLHCWSKQHNWEAIVGNREPMACSVGASLSGLRELYTGLLHVAIRSCGDRSSVFRKACLVAAKPLHQQKSSNCRSGLVNEPTFDVFFRKLLAIIASKADFKTAFDTVATALDTSEGNSLDWMRWLRHLSCNDEAGVSCSLWSEPQVDFGDMFTKYVANQLEDMEVVFLRAKTRFVSDVIFAEASRLFFHMLQKYRNARRRFINGMLSLRR